MRERLNGSDFLKRGTKFDKLNPESNAEQINNNMNYQSGMNAQKADQYMQPSLDNNGNLFDHNILADTQQSAMGIGNMLNYG